MIHSSNKAEAFKILSITAASFLILLVIIASLTNAQDISIPNFLLWHSILETLSVIMALQVFSIIWSTRKESLPANMSILAIAAFGTGILDFSHMLSCLELPNLISECNAENSNNFWTTSRTVLALGLLLVSFNSWRKPMNLPRSKKLLLIMVGIIIALHWVFIFYTNSLPRTFVQGVGLTPIKIISEYLIIIILLVTALRFYFYLQKPRKVDISSLVIATLIMAQGEFLFSLYDDTYDLYRLIGHLYKIVGYYFLYRFAFINTVKRPYALLHDLHNQNKATLKLLPDLLFEMDLDGRYIKIYTSNIHLLAKKPEQLLGKTVDEILPEKAAKTMHLALSEAALKGNSQGRVIEILLEDTSTAWFELSITQFKTDLTSDAMNFLVLSRNITERFHNQNKLNQHDSLQDLADVFEQLPLSAMLLNDRMQIIKTNLAFTKLSGYSAQEVLGLKPDFLHLGDVSYKIEQKLENGIAWSGKVKCVQKNGKKYNVFTRVFPIKDSNERVTKFLSIDENITSEERLKTSN